MKIARRKMLTGLVAFAAALPIRATFPAASSIDPVFARKALLILDLQRDFLARDGKLSVAADQAAALLVTANQLLDAAPAKGWLPIIVFNSYAPWNVANVFRHFAAVRNSRGAEIDPALKALGLPQFAKSGPDAFSNPGLSSFLRQHAVETVIVTGVFAEACVTHTVHGAIARGFHPIVISNAIASATARRRDRAVLALRNEGVEVMSSQDILRR
ncbi:MAG: cysteine hydrolase [Steroidobacteraceae bacterium]